MNDPIYEQLVTFAQEETSGIPMAEWPVEILEEFAFDLIPEGERLTVFTEKIIGLTYEGGKPKLSPTVGNTALSGYFRGYLALGYNSELSEDLTIREEVLSLRIDDIDNNIWGIPLSNVMSVEPEISNPLELLDKDDEILNDIWCAVANNSLRFDLLIEIFKPLEIESLSTKLYLDYLNNVLKLNEIVNGVLVSSYFFREGSDCVIQRLQDNDLATPEKGRSFSLIGVQYDGGENESMLCINLVNSKNSFSRTPVIDIVDVVLK